MADLKLVVFDVDGTLIDSQNDIVAAMSSAFDAVDMASPARKDILGTVGLSLDRAMYKLAPGLGEAQHDTLVRSYKAAYQALRAKPAAHRSSPLFPGIRTLLGELSTLETVLLAISTGKSRKGLDRLIASHGIGGYFSTTQVADDHPSKPHPSMLEACLRDTGAQAEHSVMIGDTTYDMEMGRAAGFKTLAVTWGYHAPEILHDCADVVVEECEEILPNLQKIWGAQA